VSESCAPPAVAAVTYSSATGGEAPLRSNKAAAAENRLGFSPRVLMPANARDCGVVTVGTFWFSLTFELLIYFSLFSPFFFLFMPFFCQKLGIFFGLFNVVLTGKVGHSHRDGWKRRDVGQFERGGVGETLSGRFWKG
jgi:hypothetical protein